MKNLDYDKRLFLTIDILFFYIRFYLKIEIEKVIKRDRQLRKLNILEKAKKK